MQPPHARTLEKLLAELDEVIDRDRQFILASELLRSRWQFIAQAMNERARQALRSGTRASSSSA
jgi:hypothetical protein